MLIGIIVACQTPYTKEVQDYWQRIFGDDIKDFKFYGQPATGPTTGHIYEALPGVRSGEPIPGPKSRTTASRWLPENTPENEVAKFLDLIFETYDYPAISSAEEIERETGFSFSIPINSTLTELGLSLNQKENVEIHVKVDKYQIQEILWDELHDKKSRMRPLARKIIDGDLGDIVVINKAALVYGYSSVVKIDSSVNPGVAAKLDALGSSSDFGLEWSKKTEGTYEAKASQPMVIAVQFAVPTQDPTRSSGNKLEPIKLTDDQFAEFMRQVNQ
jgi:hypothetical protein